MTTTSQLERGQLFAGADGVDLDVLMFLLFLSKSVTSGGIEKIFVQRIVWINFFWGSEFIGVVGSKEKNLDNLQDNGICQLFLG